MNTSTIDSLVEINDIYATDTHPEVEFVNEVLKDYWICCISREASIIGRKEVLTGKAKFGILGDGKEVPQVAMARAFQKGDWRSGYYRDQTFMMALGLCTIEQYFAQIYADAENDPFSGGRQMNCHFATPTIDPSGEWKELSTAYNISADISCTGGQMARGFGLAFASKMFRQGEFVDINLSDGGNEVCFCTIGDASTSEGIFWEVINASAVEQVPLVIAVWDDGYGISVPKELQTAKGSISDILKGFEPDEERDGLRVMKCYAHDYAGLVQVFDAAVTKSREDHIPTVIHVEECTQPQGHSTSGSHERYKSKERLEWEKDYDCIKRMGEWMITEGITSQEKLDEIKNRANKYVREAKNKAWSDFASKSKDKSSELSALFDDLPEDLKSVSEIAHIKHELSTALNPSISEILAIGRRLAFQLVVNQGSVNSRLQDWINQCSAQGAQQVNTHLYSNTSKAALNISVVPPVYTDESKDINGYQVLNQYFDHLLTHRSDVVAFGEDVGQIGDVNQGFAGLQEKFGRERVFDTGIREWSIMGQAIGLAMRGFRPIAEIQYLDYLIYGLEPLSDDLATLRYRSNGQQHAPVIIRTRGHRLEGIWHAGSPLGMIINSLRGMYVCVPRNMVQAAGMYETLIQSDDPAIVIECLNGYRLKETCPDNIGTFSVPLGSPDILRKGNDITLVSYGSCLRIAEKAIDILDQFGVEVELIDPQTLIPFDLEGVIVESLKKTNRLVILDEDVPGGASAYIMQQILEEHNGYAYLDSKPVTISAKAHRPAYGDDGEYFSKPNPEDVVVEIMKVMNELDPDAYPLVG